MAQKCSFHHGHESIALVLEREERADQEQGTVQHGQNSLGQRQFVRLGDVQLNVLIVLDGDDTRRDEHDGADQRVQDLDALVDGRAQALSCGMTLT